LPLGRERARFGRDLGTGGVKAVSRIGVSLDGGRTRLDSLRSCAPMHLRQSAGCVYVVGGAAGPLGGDELLLEIDVEAGATLVVRSVSASLALPGDGAAPSTVTVTASVGTGASLYWLPEPVIAGGGCNHRMISRVALEAGASVVWRDEVVLGRKGEPPGRIVSRMDATLEGHPLLRNELTMGGGEPGWDGPAVVGPAKAVGSLLISMPSMTACPVPVTALGPRSAILPLAGPAVLVSALADDNLELRANLNRASALLDLPFL
jgi:urease accessory protein